VVKRFMEASAGYFDRTCERKRLAYPLLARWALVKLDLAPAAKPAVEWPPLPEAPMRTRGGRRARR